MVEVFETKPEPQRTQGRNPDGSVRYPYLTVKEVYCYMEGRMQWHDVWSVALGINAEVCHVCSARRRVAAWPGA